MTTQLNLSLSYMPELTRRHRSLREVISAGIHERGLTRIAGELDESPSHLSEALAGGKGERIRKFDVDLLEEYMHKTGDLTPLHYLCAKFLPSPEAAKFATQARLLTLARQLAEEMAHAGIGEEPTPARKSSLNPRRRG